MSTPKRKSFTVRLAVPVQELIDKLGQRLGLSGASLLELLAREGAREGLGRPPAAFTKWHDNQGAAEKWERRFTDDGIVAIKDCAKLTGLTQAGVVEFLVWSRARAEGLL